MKLSLIARHRRSMTTKSKGPRQRSTVHRRPKNGAKEEKGRKMNDMTLSARTISYINLHIIIEGRMNEKNVKKPPRAVCLFISVVRCRFVFVSICFGLFSVRLIILRCPIFLVFLSRAHVSECSSEYNLVECELTRDHMFAFARAQINNKKR